MRRQALSVVVTLTIATVMLGAAPAGAQQLSRVSLDSVGALDLFRGDGTSGNPGASFDISGVVRIGGGWSAQIRPWFFKSSSAGSLWNRELYQAAVKYERNGALSTRLDAGFITSPIGLGMLDMRADVNPTIQTHMSYVMPLLAFDTSAPSVRAISSSYPLGANLTLSTTTWDARAALVSSSPTRRYAVNSRTPNPKATPVVIAGGGVTPRPGLRIGTSFASGHYATADELKVAGGDRTFLTWTAEGEFAVNYTKLSAELTRTRFDSGAARSVASTWFVQGMQTLTPRWFVAARHEAIETPPMAIWGPAATSRWYRSSEASAGYRVTPELTLRASLNAVRGYTATTTDTRVGVRDRLVAALVVVASRYGVGPAFGSCASR
ncbi:MAG: hypothetical protein QM736_11555 [Vicinamibacterales bacterium]